MCCYALNTSQTHCFVELVHVKSAKNKLASPNFYEETCLSFYDFYQLDVFLGLCVRKIRLENWSVRQDLCGQFPLELALFSTHPRGQLTRMLPTTTGTPGRPSLPLHLFSRALLRSIFLLLLFSRPPLSVSPTRLSISRARSPANPHSPTSIAPYFVQPRLSERISVTTGWSTAYTESGKLYYRNDLNQTTSWDKPTTAADSSRSTVDDSVGSRSGGGRSMDRSQQSAGTVKEVPTSPLPSGMAACLSGLL